MKNDKARNVKAAAVLGVTLKGKIGQTFCRHKEKRWFTDTTARTNRGIVKLLICLDCGKCCGRRFDEFEGAGFK